MHPGEQQRVGFCGSQESYDFLIQPAITTLAIAHGLFSAGLVPASRGTAGLAVTPDCPCGFTRNRELCDNPITSETPAYQSCSINRRICTCPRFFPIPCPLTPLSGTIHRLSSRAAFVTDFATVFWLSRHSRYAPRAWIALFSGRNSRETTRTSPCRIVLTPAITLCAE